jgi:AAHS family 4-hydroxybenzoate transporter-like MFS transporter
MARGKREQAVRTARGLLKEEIELEPERHATDSEDGKSVGVLHASNFRFNLGIGLGFTAATFVAYGILNWTTTFLTASGFTLPQAGGAVAVAGITSMVGSVAAGLVARRFGSRTLMLALGVSLLAILAALAVVVETLPAAPDDGERLMAVSLVGAAAAAFSASIATMYVIMVAGYPLAHRSAGIGFGIFTSRVGAISGSGLGGVLLDLGAGSVAPFFAALAGAAMLVAAAAFIIDRHVPPFSSKASPAAA